MDLLQSVTMRKSLAPKTKVKKMRRVTIGLAILMAVGMTDADGHDLAKLGSILEPVYYAMFIGVLCSPDDPGFLSSTGGRFGTVNEYLQRAKKAATIGLPPEEAVTVLKAGADPSIARVRGKLHELASKNEGAGLVGAVMNFCATEGRRIVRNEIVRQDLIWDRAKQQIERARE